MKWFDREFRFDLPAWMYPAVIERLRGTPGRLEERCAGLPAELLTRRPDDGGWSIQENVGHLLDLEPLWAGRLDDLREGRAELRPADVTNRRTHEADHNAASIEELLRDFRSTRLAFVEGLENAEPELVERVARHPRLDQPMRLIDSAFFAAEHDDHHLARITELRCLRGAA